MSVHYSCLVCAMLIWIFQVQITACSFSLYGRGQPMGWECYQWTHPQLPRKYSTWCGAYAHECCILQRWPTPQNKTLHYCVLQSEKRWNKAKSLLINRTNKSKFSKGRKKLSELWKLQKKKSVLAKEDIILKKQYHCHITRQHIVQTREASHAINEHCKDKPWYNVIIYSCFINWEINWI